MYSFNALRYSYLHLSQSCSLESRRPCLSTLVLLARNGFLGQCTSQQEKPGIYSLLSLFPWGWPLPSHAVLPWGTGGTGNVLILSGVSKLIILFIYLFLLQQSVQIPPWKAGLLQGLCYPWVSAQVSILQVFPQLQPGGSEADSLVFPLSAAPSEGCLDIIACTEGESTPRSPSKQCWVPQGLLQRHFCLWMDVSSVVWKGNVRTGMMRMSLPGKSVCHYSRNKLLAKLDGIAWICRSSWEEEGRFYFKGIFTNYEESEPLNNREERSYKVLWDLNEFCNEKTIFTVWGYLYFCA